MAEYRRELSKKIKLICPACGDKVKTFVPYIDNATGDIIHETVGKCDREINCGYHKRPREYFEETGTKPQTQYIQPPQREPIKPLEFIPDEVKDDSLTGYGSNEFVKWLYRLFGRHVALNAVAKYQIGTDCSLWHGSTVFWFITKYNRVKAGQIKKFNPDGRTASYFSNSQQQNRKCTGWVHAAIKYQHEKEKKPLPEWLTPYIDRGDYCTCLYGEHLLSDKEHCSKPIALVEAPKSAIIGSIYLPQYTWLAVGALSYFTEQRIKVLTGKEVYLFPDLSPEAKAFKMWDDRGKAYSHIANFITVDTLEKTATEEDRQKGLDIADFLIMEPYKPYLINQYKQRIKGVTDLTEMDAIKREYWDRGLTANDIKTIDKEINNAA